MFICEMELINRGHFYDDKIGESIMLEIDVEPAEQHLAKIKKAYGDNIAQTGIVTFHEFYGGINCKSSSTTIFNKNLEIVSFKMK